MVKPKGNKFLNLEGAIYERDGRNRRGRSNYKDQKLQSALPNAALSIWLESRFFSFVL